MVAERDDRPRRNGLPLVSKKRWAAGHRGGLKPISQKRQKALKTKAMDVPQTDRRCELLPLLRGVSGWLKYREAWPEVHPDWSLTDRHHVFGQRWHDREWNIVLACRPVHEFCGNCWQQAGRLVSMVALHRAGRFDPVTVREAIGKCPLGSLENWMEDGLFDREAVLKLYAVELLNYYGRAA